MALDLSGFRDPKLGKRLIEGITAIAWAALESCGGEVKLMEVCGTHTVALARCGIRSVLPKGIQLVSGPGCPVCVTANADIDAIIALSHMEGVKLATFGDMVRVPGSTSSLANEKAKGADVAIVYSPLDALRIAKENPESQVVFVGVGFETTTPLVASVVKRACRDGIENFSVFSAHKTVPNTLRVLVSDPALSLSGLILPGHVSTIIGKKPYEFLSEDFGVPGVIMGFEPVDLLSGILLLLRMIAEGKPSVKNDYRRCVRDEGNIDAQEAIAEVFEPCDAEWRGLGLIGSSGYRITGEYEVYDAARRFTIEAEPTVEPKGCRCGDVLRGALSPKQCPLFGSVCTPEKPTGPCMVSSEGSCAAYYKYLR